MHNPFGHKNLGKPTDLQQEVARRLLRGPHVRESNAHSEATREVPARPARRFGNLPLLDFPNSPTMEQANEDVTTSANGPHAPSPNATSPIPLLQFPNSPGMNGDEQADAGTDAEANQAGENPLQLLAHGVEQEEDHDTTQTSPSPAQSPDAEQAIPPYNDITDESAYDAFIRFANGEEGPVSMEVDFALFPNTGQTDGPIDFQNPPLGDYEVYIVNGERLDGKGSKPSFSSYVESLTENGEYPIRARLPLHAEGNYEDINSPEYKVGNVTAIFDGKIIVKDGKKTFVGKSYLANDRYDFNVLPPKDRDIKGHALTWAARNIGRGLSLPDKGCEVRDGRTVCNGYDVVFTPHSEHYQPGTIHGTIE